MNIKRSITIRRIEEKDKGTYLKIFNDEDFGCISINSILKPSIYEEEATISKIIDKSIIDEEVLIIEDNNEFIGYAAISRPSEHTYHIGQFVIRKDRQRQGYGTKLMKQIKRYASQDSCEIMLECISPSINFFKKNGFIHKYSSTYIMPRKKTLYPKKDSLFVDYSMIEEAREKETRKEKTINPELIKKIMEL